MTAYGGLSMRTILRASRTFTLAAVAGASMLLAHACNEEALECEGHGDCPAGEDCEVGRCEGGTCSVEQADAGTACSFGECDEGGGCLCRSAEDCPPGEDCEDVVCDQGACLYPLLPFASDCEGGACDTDGTCVPFPCADPGECECGAGLACSDAQESNHTQGDAWTQPQLSDCSRVSYCGAVADGSEDWFVYSGTDDAACNVAPTVFFTNANLEVCQYFSCSTTPTSFGCPVDTTADVSPNGEPGCCGRAPWGVDPCAGGLLDDEDATVWVRVRRLSGDPCEPYALTLEY